MLFATIHGNGRIGRILIPLYLHHIGMLREPMFYLSDYLESNRQEYYDRLLAVSRDGDWTGWCEFFLKAVQKQAITNEAKAKAILTLYEEKKRWIVEETHSQHAIAALDFLFKTPIFNTSDFRHCDAMPDPSARRILRILKETEFLTLVREGSGPRPAVYAFTELLNIAEGRDVF